MQGRVSRRRFLTTGAMMAAGGMFSCSKEAPLPAGAPPQAKPEETAAALKPAPQPKGRVIILGFDGAEPTLVESMLDAGRLPNLKKLRETGAFMRLRSTIPPQSPAAWNSFTTCKNPGGHGIYDFIRRNPATQLPDIGTSKLLHPTKRHDGTVADRAKAIGFRKGDPFWVVADRAGIRCKLFNVPYAFPADSLEHGKMLCGLDVPEIRGSQNSFSAFSDAYTPEQLEENISGGARYALEFVDGKAAVAVRGARIPKASQRERSEDTELPFEFTVDRSARTLTVSAQANTVTLGEGAWSEWLEWTFEPAQGFEVKAISRFYLMEAGERVRLYMSAFQFHPDAPYAPMSCPEGYMHELRERYGLFKTLGWAHETHALREDELTEKGFLEDSMRTMEWRAMLTLDELERDDFDVLISAWTATDRIGHMFWRYRDPEHPMYDAEGAKLYGQALEQSYEKMDEIVGKVMPKIQENDLFIVMSDHGFETFRKGFNINTWLVRNGYAAVEGQDAPETAVGEKGFLMDFDWTRTRAYAIGLSSMYLNIQGRERNGIVPPEQADALIQELREKLLAVTDPDTGEKVFEELYSRDVYSGVAVHDAPDISLGYARGYQNTKSAAKGAIPKELLIPNLDKWSGDHVASNFSRIPGMLFVNRPLAAEEPDIRDLGVTTLAYVDVKPPEDFEGRNLV
ncbi:MAG TPA: alkaline phosphatase family protein [Candidatus Hydrogenedentes bacterium]|nr:alkaline phosphatase family protein [Candidatus Hydrogenedentota bacterium]HQH51143.1 alkaline phosphatase family protein [Candidatus Hydrogenedentota bacterium]HQM47449.1 alkaline phosphatase family protein [Candidatus Hydrogenedentota bacterium]